MKDFLLQYSCLILLAFFGIHYVRNKFRPGLYNIPGPFLASLTRLWLMWDIYQGKSMLTDIKLHKEYGPLVRTAPNKISVSDFEATKIIYSTAGHFVKSDWYRVQNQIIDGKERSLNLFTTPNEELHTQFKRNIAPMYTQASIASLESQVDRVSELFMGIMDGIFAKTEVEFDLGEWLQWYAIDVIGSITFSKPFGFLEKGTDVDTLLFRIHKFFRYSTVMGHVPDLHFRFWTNPIIIKVLSTDRLMPIADFATKVIQKRLLGKEGEFTDMLSKMKAMSEQSNRELSMDGVKSAVAGNIFAGSDTTAIALRAMIILLSLNPRCLDKLRAEIDELDAAGRLSPTIQVQEADQMAYLQACIKESMRLHPAIALNLERVVPDGGTRLCGKFIPPGTVVGVSAWVAGRDRIIFGDDVDVFRPERWIEASPDQLRDMNRHSLAFGAGSRICLGKHISLMEISKLIPQLYRQFDIDLAHPEKEIVVTSWWFATQHAMICTIKPRTGDAKKNGRTN